MASTYKDEQEKIAQQQAANTSLASSLSETAGTQTEKAASPGKTDYIGRMNELATQKYVASDNVTAAQNYLQSIIDSKPGSYESKYTDQLQGLYDRIMNREKFSYDLNGDMLYRQYADQYTRQGRMAMQDTMGQAATLTGGYGNSYAQTAGQQVFQGYLQQLNNMVPELANAAYNRYAQEGNELQNQYALAQSAEQLDYGRYQDAVSQWQNERAYAQDAYNTAYSQDYTDYTNRMNLAQQTLQMEREDAQRAQETAYQTAMAMIQKGVLPTSDLLAIAGISDADALELAKKYGYKVPGSGGGGGGSSKKSSSSSSKTTSTTIPASSNSYATMNSQLLASTNKSTTSSKSTNYDAILAKARAASTKKK
jgi:hypothetical protein